MTLVIKGREAWGALPPSKPLIPIDIPVDITYVHHSAVDNFGPTAIKGFQHFHMTKKDMRDIAYNLLIDYDGTCYEGRGIGYAHGGNTGEDNRISQSVCLMGNCDEHPPSLEQMATLTDVLVRGKVDDWWTLNDVRGHRQEPGASTKCPGRYTMLQLPHIIAVARQRANQILNPGKEWDDMATKAEVRAALREELRDMFTDEPGTGKGYAIGNIVKRLTRELDAPSSEFRQKLIETVQSAETE